MRAGRAQLTEAYVYLRNGEAFLIGAHLSPLRTASTHVDCRPDPHAQAAAATTASSSGLIGAVERRGYTLVPLELYWKNGRAKLAHRPRQGQEAARQARDREGARLAARQGASPAPRLRAYSGASFGFFIS